MLLQKNPQGKVPWGFAYFLRSFWQYWVHSLSVHSEHFSAALDFSQNRSG